MRWPGFRKVRRQVCKRVDRRIEELQLSSVDAYRSYLEAHPDEWDVLDGMCRITISRFYRDKKIFAALATRILPELARSVRASGRRSLSCWCAGCASGEEPYTLAMMWSHSLGQRFSDLRLRIVATDVDPLLLERARLAVYSPSVLKDLPAHWRERSFREGPEVDRFHLRSVHRRDVEFRRHDIRSAPLQEEFDLVLCRNLAFTYFVVSLQRAVLASLRSCLVRRGVLVVGAHETLPEDAGTRWTPWPGVASCYLNVR
jgi:chemotaxis protein methyltransferase CheR